MSKQHSGVIVGQKGVQYGLQKVVPKKSGAQPASAPRKVAPANVFGNDDSEEEDVERQIARQADKKRAAAKVQQMYEDALAQDPLVFDYDGVYDSIQAARVAPKQQDKMQRQSKYISSLLDQAAQRKREQDVLYERRMVKERHEEDHLYEDKERFVTSAYRKKLEEDKKWLEAEKQKELEEQRNDVRKVGHLGNFYANLLTKNVAYGTAQPGRNNEDGEKKLAVAGAQEASGGAEGRDDRAASASPARSGGSGGGGGGCNSAPTGPSAKTLAQLDRYDLLRLEAEQAMRERKRMAEQQRHSIEFKEAAPEEEQERRAEDRQRAPLGSLFSEPQPGHVQDSVATAGKEEDGYGSGGRAETSSGAQKTIVADTMEAPGRGLSASMAAREGGLPVGVEGGAQGLEEGTRAGGKRRNDDTAVQSARERYLARKQQKTS